jgi:transcriptional regulator with PAS, ATPase and Fis domain
MRANGPFVAVNCASIPRDLIESELFGYEKGAFTGALNEGNPGKFELANHGTLFLDEIGEMALEFQAKLLRAVETLRIRRIGGKKEIPLDIRIIAATNRDLQKEAEKGHFRQDLFYRLNVLSLAVPPLRERKEDIIYDAEHFLERYNRKYPDQKKTMSFGFEQELLTYDWPGNVRELQNGIERTFYAVSGDVLEASDFQYISVREPAAVRGEADVNAQAEQKERAQRIQQAIEKYRQALLEADFDTEKAAQILNMSRATFYRRCRKYGISPRSLAKEYNRVRSHQEE